MHYLISVVLLLVWGFFVGGLIGSIVAVGDLCSRSNAAAGNLLQMHLCSTYSHLL